MPRTIDLKCCGCGIIFKRLKYVWDAKLREGRPDRPYCSKNCLFNDKKTDLDTPCINCGKLTKARSGKIKRNKNGIFCCVKCFWNFISRDKSKQVACVNCGKIKKIPLSKLKENKLGNFFCDKKCETGHLIIQKICEKCNQPFNTKQWNKIKKCVACRKYRRITTTLGISSCFICQQPFFHDIHKSKKMCRNSICLKTYMDSITRSKNEIWFADKIKEHFPNSNITLNEKFFQLSNGKKWDADIIMHDEKIAIHWNGAWHYQPIYSQKRLEFTQKSDNIKYPLIESYGYVNYIIQDLGSASEKKVEEEFMKFLQFVAALRQNPNPTSPANATKAIVDGSGIPCVTKI